MYTRFAVGWSRKNKIDSSIVQENGFLNRKNENIERIDKSNEEGNTRVKKGTFWNY